MLLDGREDHVLVEKVGHFDKSISSFCFVKIKGSVQAVFELAVVLVEASGLIIIGVEDTAT